MEPSETERLNPRTSRVRQVVLDAAMTLLLDEGANEVTATRVAKETGVARTTIYRQWPDHASLLLTTIEELVTPRRGSPDTGDVEADLTTSLTQLRTRLVMRQVHAIFGAILDYASRDEAFEAAQRNFIIALTSPTCDVLEAAKQRGEISTAVDCSRATVVLTGPLLHQHLLSREVIEDDMIDEIVSQFVQLHRTPMG